MMSSPPAELNSDQWLLRHAQNVTSLSGEDGILGQIFKMLPPGNRWCVEFGAWDGRTYSNTWNLMTGAGWNGVFIEADPARFKELLVTYHGNPLARCFNCFINFEGDNSLDNVLRRAGCPVDPDLLSIDIDGNDYHVWESLREYVPRVVVIEFNQTIPSHVEFVQPRDMRVQQGSAPLSLVLLGRAKGYELVCVTEYNLIFVRAGLLPVFGLKDNSLARLRIESPALPHIFQLFDGTFVVGGMDRMFWHGLPVRQEKFQILPRLFRNYPPRPGNWFKRILKRAWLFCYQRGWF